MRSLSDAPRTEIPSIDSVETGEVEWLDWSGNREAFDAIRDMSLQQVRELYNTFRRATYDETKAFLLSKLNFNDNFWHGDEVQVIAFDLFLLGVVRDKEAEGRYTNYSRMVRDLCDFDRDGDLSDGDDHAAGTENAVYDRLIRMSVDEFVALMNRADVQVSDWQDASKRERACTKFARYYLTHAALGGIAAMEAGRSGKYHEEMKIRDGQIADEIINKIGEDKWNRFKQTAGEHQNVREILDKISSEAEQTKFFSILFLEFAGVMF